jgi:hypothetical protein
MSAPVVKWAMACFGRGLPQLVALRMDGDRWVSLVPVLLTAVEVSDSCSPTEAAELLRSRMYMAAETARRADVTNRPGVEVEKYLTILGDAS